MLHIIKGINESKTLTKHISCKYKCKFGGRKCNSSQKWDNDKCKCKKHHICEKSYIWNPDACSCKNGKYLASITEDSVILCDEIIDTETKTVPTTIPFCKTKKFYILLAFLVITIVLLIAVTIYCYLIKYKEKQKHLLPHYITINKLKEFCINKIL